MSREIKFRAWNNKDNKYYEVCALHHFLDWGGWGYEVEVNGRKSFNVPANAESEYDDGILEQFTGLKDKNGKEISQGDILSPNNREVRFGEYFGLFGMGTGFYTVCHDNEYDELPFGMTSRQVSESTIIGTIHENPELLTKGANNG